MYKAIPYFGSLLKIFNICREWLKMGGPFFLSLGVTAVCLFFLSTEFFTPEQRIRYTGMVLQLLAISVIAWDIRRTRKLFGLEGSAVLNWLKSYPGLSRGAETITLRATHMSPNNRFGRHRVAQNMGEKTSLDARMQALEANLKEGYQEIGSLYKLIEDEVRNWEAVLIAERQAREAEYQDIRQYITLAHTGGLQFSVMSVVWLFVGVIMSTLSTEIASFVDHWV
jgi:hypothetical protein